MSTPHITLTHSPHKLPDKARLSILIPFYRDDPSQLIAALSDQLTPGVEILVYDDGTGDSALSRNVSAAIKNAAGQACLFTAHENRGRAFGRNYLFHASQAEWVLFLDADMMPMSDHFIRDYTALIEQNSADVIFGGFKVLMDKGEASRELHRIMSITSDCADAAERAALGPKHVASSNLCVKKVVLDAEEFDHGFKGWGWEDSEWAARIAQSFHLLHADIPALHLGLETTDTLLRRFKTSGPNYARFARLHPDLATSLPLYRWIMRFKKIPGQSLLRPLYKLCVKLPLLPVKLRITSLKLWRASWYTEAF